MDQNSDSLCHEICRKDMKFSELSPMEQKRATAIFFDASVDDGYLYELDCDGHVLCRKKAVER